MIFKGNERQRVYLATQLLSSSVSSLMRQSGMHSQANLLQIFDDFFDVFNSKEEFMEDFMFIVLLFLYPFYGNEMLSPITMGPQG